MSTRLSLLALSVALLAACSRPAEEPAAPSPAGESAPVNPAPAQDTPAPADDPAETPADPAPPPPEAPPPTEPSPTAKPTSAAHEPPLDAMKPARTPAKIGVPVDLKYSFDAPPGANQPVTLHLAAVPKVSGSNLTVSVKKVDGIQVASTGVLGAQKATANGAYRQHYSVTRQASGPTELRVLVTMETSEGSAFGFFGIPLDADSAAGNSPQKLNSVKQR